VPTRELKQKTPALTPIAEPAEPHPNTHNAFLQPILPAVTGRTPASIAQGAVRAAVAPLAEVTQDPNTE
jgi:hypothetical protein